MRLWPWFFTRDRNYVVRHIKSCQTYRIGFDHTLVSRRQTLLQTGAKPRAKAVRATHTVSKEEKGP